MSPRPARVAPHELCVDWPTMRSDDPVATVLTYLLLGIVHPGRVTWARYVVPRPHPPSQRPPPYSFAALQPPNTATSPPYLPTLGLLAAVLGDISVQVLSIPHPTTSRIGTSEPANGQLPQGPPATLRLMWK